MATEKSTQQVPQESPQPQSEAAVVQTEPITDENIEPTVSEAQQTSPVDFSDEEAQLAAAALDTGDADEDEDENPDLPAVQQTEALDLSAKSKTELVDMLEQLLAARPVQTLRGDIEAVKIAFYKKHRAEVEAQKKAFVEAGGAEEEFSAPLDAQELRLKDLVGEYRRRRDEFLAGLENAKQENLKIKQEIIEELKKLIDSGETLGQTFTVFRDLQNRWRETGPVPQANVKDLWETYNLYVENFYGFIKINKELRDLDLKRNYETKISLCEQAEALVMEPSIVEAFTNCRSCTRSGARRVPWPPNTRNSCGSVSRRPARASTSSISSISTI